MLTVTTVKANDGTLFLLITIINYYNLFPKRTKKEILLAAKSETLVNVGFISTSGSLKRRVGFHSVCLCAPRFIRILLYLQIIINSSVPPLTMNTNNMKVAGYNGMHCEV